MANIKDLNLNCPNFKIDKKAKNIKVKKAKTNPLKYENKKISIQD